MTVNDINTNPDSKDFGKGPNCTMLTLRKYMERDMYFHKEGKRPIAANRTKANPRSNIVILRGVTSEPNSENGLGRRAYVYSLRANAPAKTAVKAAAPSTPRKARKAKTATVTAPSGVSDATQKYEELKAILAAPSTPVPVEKPAEQPATVTVPAVTITPEATPAPVTPVAPAPAPEAAPVVPPVAQESANAEQATPVPVA
jgi:hypothetical protein